MPLYIPPEDLSLVHAIRPYVGARANSLLDTLTDILGTPGAEEQGIALLESFSVREKLNSVLANAYNLFLILILLLLSEGELGAPSQAVNEIYLPVPQSEGDMESRGEEPA
jgi:hypothetical protein